MLSVTGFREVERAWRMLCDGLFRALPDSLLPVHNGQNGRGSGYCACGGSGGARAAEAEGGAVFGDRDWFEADLVEVAAASTAMLRVGGEVQALARSEVLAGRGAYGDGQLAGAAGRFSSRYAHLVHALGEQVADAGEVLRVTAVSYRDTDLQAPGPYGSIEARLPPGSVPA